MIEIHNVSIIVAIACLPWNEVVVLEVQGSNWSENYSILL